MFSLNINDTQQYTFSIESGLQLVTEHVTKSVSEKDGEIKHTYRYIYKYIANFWPEIISRIEVNNNGDIALFFKCILHFSDGTKSEPVTENLKWLGKSDWPNDIDLRCILNPDVSKAREHVANIVRSTCYDAPVEKMTVIERLGTHIPEGIPVFNAGDRLIWPSDLEVRPTVKWNPLQNVRLAVDSSCSEQDAEAGMMRIIDLSPDAGRIIFSFNILSILREAFIKSGITPRCCVFVYGSTGNKKTTYTGFQSQHYNRDTTLESLPRLNASIAAAVKLLYEKSDCVVVLDDLFPAQNSEIHRQQEKTLLEVTRVIADGIEPARMRGQKVAKAPPRCGVLFTGEYYIGTGSDAARLLPVKMATPINNDKLTACQREPLILSTFYDYFIDWYISNFDNICSLLKEWLIVYRSTKSDIHPRLQETQFCFEAAFKIFLTYRIEKGFIMKETMLDQYHSFYQQLRTIVREQNNRVSQGGSDNLRRVDYLAIIRSLYRDKRFCLAVRVKDFEAKEPPDGIIHGDHIYFRRDGLLTKIRICEPPAEFDDILSSLKEQQALKPGKSSNSRKISGSGLRFYAIKLSKLQ